MLGAYRSLIAILAVVALASVHGEPSDMASRLSEADKLFRAGEFKSAENLYHKLSTEFPKSDEALQRLIVCYSSMQRFSEAEAILERIRLRAPDSVAYHKARLSLLESIPTYRQGGAWQKEQFELLTKIIELDPKDGDACFNLAVCYATKQPPDKETGRRFYQRSLDLGGEPDKSLETLLDWKPKGPLATPPPGKKQR